MALLYFIRNKIRIKKAAKAHVNNQIIYYSFSEMSSPSQSVYSINRPANLTQINSSGNDLLAYILAVKLPNNEEKPPTYEELSNK